MRKTCVYAIIVVVAALVAMAACSRGEKSKELAALDKAYQAGVLTKDEYDVKKAVLDSQTAALTALDKALEAGVISKEEYQARKTRLAAQAGALVNNRGEYLLSDQEGFDPSVTLKEDWKPLEHVKP